MDCSKCGYCYDDDDYLYCSKYSKYVNSYSQCSENK